MKKRILILLLITVLTLSYCVGCGAKKNESETTPSAEFTDPNEHLVSDSKRLHRKTVSDSGRTFVNNCNTLYKIILGNVSLQSVKAANFLSTEIGECTGAYPSVIYDDDENGLSDDNDSPINYTKNSKYIVISHSALERTAAIEWATDKDKSINLGYSGYMIKSAGESVFIKVNSEYGYQAAVLCFLKEVLGYEWFSEDMITFTKSGATLPDMDIVEKPDFDLNYRSGYISDAGKFASGQTDLEPFVYTEGAFVHNSFIYLPPNTYAEDHSDWYSDGWYTEPHSKNYEPYQLCYTAHGNKTEYDKMLATAVDAVMEYLKKNTASCTITFTQQDNYNACDCETCTSAKKAFGSISSTYIMFVNDLEDKIREKLKDEAAQNGGKQREITILFFAYNSTKDAPVSGENSSEYKVAVNTDNLGGTLPYNKTYPGGIVCNAGVGCFWAPINASFNHSFWSDNRNNTEIRKLLEKWGKVTDKLYAWIYDTDFYYYLYPYNSFDSLFETARCLKDNNADFLFVQAQGNVTPAMNCVTTCFGSLKSYCAYSLRFDVNINYGDTLNKFFDNYFREAAKPMRDYFDKLTLYLRILEEKYPSVFTGNIYDSLINSDKYWPVSMMEEWLGLCDEAFSAIEKYKTTDSELYEVLRKHILTETIFPRFIICEFFGGYYSNSDILSKRQSLCDDCRLLKIGLYSENVVLSDWFEKWGVI